MSRPQNTTPPSLTGSPLVGQTIVLDVGVWDQPYDEVEIIWQEFDTPPSDAEVANLTLTALESTSGGGDIPDTVTGRAEIANLTLTALLSSGTGAVISLPSPAALRAPADSVIEDALRTARFRRMLEVDFILNGVSVAGTNHSTTPVSITDGNITLDSASTSRRQLNMNFLGGRGDVISGMLRQYDSLEGLEIHVRMGIATDFGEDWEDVGVFLPDTAQHNQGISEYTVALTALDRSILVNRHTRTSILTIPRNTNAAEAYTTFIRAHYPEAEFILDNLEETTPIQQSMNFGTDVDNWQEAIKLAAAFGCETFVDRQGRFVLRRTPDPRTAAVVARYSDSGRDDFPFAGDPIVRSIDLKTAYNGVIVRGEAPLLLFSVRGEVWDTNPQSEMYYDPAHPDESRVGPMPLEIGDTYVATAEAAQNMAQSKFNEIVGMNEPVTFSAMVDPRVEPGDVYWCKSAHTGLDHRVVVDRATLPFAETSLMTVQGRKIS